MQQKQIKKEEHKMIPETWTESGCSGECRPRLVQFINATNIVLMGAVSFLVTQYTQYTIHKTTEQMKTTQTQNK